MWEDLPSQMRLELEREASGESKPESRASLLTDPALRPEESIVLDALRADESVQIDELLEKLEMQLTSSEVFTALSSLRSAAGCVVSRERTMCARSEFSDPRAKFRACTIPLGTTDFRNFARNKGCRFASRKGEGEWKRGRLPC